MGASHHPVITAKSCDFTHKAETALWAAPELFEYINVITRYSSISFAYYGMTINFILLTFSDSLFRGNDGIFYHVNGDLLPFPTGSNVRGSDNS